MGAVCPESVISFSDPIPFSYPIFKKGRGSLDIGRLITWSPDSRGAFGNTKFFASDCPVTVMTGGALAADIPEPSGYTFPLPGSELTMEMIDFTRLCQNLLPELRSDISYIIGGESEWVFPPLQQSKIDLTCVLARPCADGSEYLVSVAKCAYSSFQMPVSLSIGAMQCKFGHYTFLE